MIMNKHFNRIKLKSNPCVLNINNVHILLNNIDNISANSKFSLSKKNGSKVKHLDKLKGLNKHIISTGKTSNIFLSKIPFDSNTLEYALLN